MEKKATEFKVRTAPINAATALAFAATIKADLDDGWDVFSAAPMGIDTGAGVGGAGSVMMCVTLVKYEYFEPK
jgi:hypothetical protein